MVTRRTQRAFFFLEIIIFWFGIIPPPPPDKRGVVGVLNFASSRRGKRVAEFSRTMLLEKAKEIQATTVADWEEEARFAQILKPKSKYYAYWSQQKTKPWPFCKIGSKMELLIDNRGKVWERPEPLHFFEKICILGQLTSVWSLFRLHIILPQKTRNYSLKSG